jgi:hypothetical protein
MTPETKIAPDSKLAMLRHTVATLAYRARKPLVGAPADFSSFALAAPQTPGKLLAHLCDLFAWALSHCDGEEKWYNSPIGAWEQDTARFFAALEAFDRRLASGVPLRCDIDRLFQGPIADALTHVGQLAMLRRLAGAKITGENYFVAEITTGRCGIDQPKGVQEF